VELRNLQATPRNLAAVRFELGQF